MLQRPLIALSMLSLLMLPALLHAAEFIFDVPVEIEALPRMPMADRVTEGRVICSLLGGGRSLIKTHKSFPITDNFNSKIEIVISITNEEIAKQVDSYTCYLELCSKGGRCQSPQANAPAGSTTAVSGRIPK